MVLRVWTNSDGGSWNDPLNWSGGIVPAADDEVVFNNLAGSYTVTIDDPSFAGTLDLNDPEMILAIGTETFTVASSTSFDAGTLTMSLDATVTLGTATLAEGTLITGAGDLFATLGGSGKIEATGLLRLHDDIPATGIDFTIAPTGNMVVIDAVAAGNTFTFDGNDGALSLANAEEFDGTVIGLTAGKSETEPTNSIVLEPFTTVTFDNATNQLILGGSTIGTIQLDPAAFYGPGTTAEFIDNGTSVEAFLFASALCFAEGTSILTDRGDVAVESLAQGDRVIAVDQGRQAPRPVKWLGHRRIDLAAHPRPETVAPIRILTGAFADAMPHRDLLVSPDHAIFVDGKLICARQLINGTTIRQEMGWTAVNYYHVELDEHAILLAEGLPAESYLNTGNQGFFANADEPLVLHPDLTDEADHPTRAAGSCAPFVWDEESVRPIWQRLAERATALGRPMPTLETTEDPGLRIMTNGRAMRPLYGENGKYMFALSKGATEVRLVSRAAAPTDTRPWMEDRRHLGVRIARMVVRSGNDLREIPVDHPDLAEGWWAVERDNTVLLRRWTSGDAVVPLPEIDGQAMLEVHVSDTVAYLVEHGNAGEPGRQVA